MFTIRLSDQFDDDVVRAVPVGPLGLPRTSGEELAAFASSLDTPGEAGTVNVLPRPLGRPSTIFLIGVGDGDEAGWRAAGAELVRRLPVGEPSEILLPSAESPDAVRGLAEGLWLGGYRYRDAREERRTGEVRLVVQGQIPGTYADALAHARIAAKATWLARDLTNTPSSTKSPGWMAEEATGASAKREGVTVTVRSHDELSRFGGLRAVGGGSVTSPRLVEVSWNPEGATTHVVLVGKGITFDSGGLSIKTRPSMLLMRNDMGGAAAVLAATLAAADESLAVRVTALLPLAENAVSGSAYRPGDVITQYDGTTTESTNSDAEGRLVLADALAYAVAELAPDVIVDVATLTGSQKTALGMRTAALYAPGDDLAAALTEAAGRAGERLWRMPLPDEYREYLHSDIADRHSSPTRGAGSVVAALFLQEFVGDRADRWAHLDIASPCWAAETEGELVKGATGWGVRTLLRYLESVSV